MKTNGAKIEKAPRNILRYAKYGIKFSAKFGVTYSSVVSVIFNISGKSEKFIWKYFAIY